ncbi:hypothetical protein ACH5RR_010308 [Cinchona calisaya]|uniref:DUF7731 domain-containing protein n=1 Tax=Cinchona calisaya TaxID=153742 RepID=A0ABD3AGK7_9GENT
MEKFQSRQNSRVGILYLFLCIFALFCCVNAENKTFPTANNNLSPIQQWRSAFYCLNITSTSCPVKYTLNMSGRLNVVHEDGPTFCEAGGCADHTRAVLACIHDVKPDFWFGNNATVKNLNDTINIGCSLGFNGTTISSGAYEVKSASISVLAAVLLLALFYI